MFAAPTACGGYCPENMGCLPPLLLLSAALAAVTRAYWGGAFDDDSLLNLAAWWEVGDAAPVFLEAVMVGNLTAEPMVSIIWVGGALSTVAIAWPAEGCTLTTTFWRLPLVTGDFWTARFTIPLLEA